MSFRKRLSPRRTIVAAGLAVVVASFIAVGAARVMSNDDVRKPKLSSTLEVTSVDPVAARAQIQPEAPTMQREPDVMSQSLSTLTPTNGEPAAGESDRRAADNLAPPREHHARKVARTHRQQRHAGPREPRHDMGPAFGFAQDERFANRGHPMYSQTPWPRRAFGQPSGWGW